MARSPVFCAGHCDAAEGVNAIIQPDQRNRLVGILGRLGSEFDGERAAAGLLATRLLKQIGVAWDEIIAAPAVAHEAATPLNWRSEVSAASRSMDMLTPWEREFLTGLAQQGRITQRQRRQLDRITLKVAAGGRR